ncbi:DNA replication complex GINS protein PSF2 [Chloropicon primus]|uniref:DNA replication complex GINS protein PSF2 n=1 Tax=Chloropicon primus TaxID=1764295 RepID=A0A5B8MEJ9_9CHLO|nr:DNA replication complex GINS protein PSF2 [Chloropicon primus]UPQ97803.1 DNA replication complex GINS protein PSF2 [Chloropicon primus]|eukprot:QDZ18594.1 DNA replication complex GINS protein PSF2 [Chloropicon primus]
MREGGVASSLTNEELQYCAENETITIIPNFSTASLHLVNGEYGPFRAQNEATVPFWLASLLRKRNLCRVKPPEWMKSEALIAVLAEEKRSPNEWQELPHHYIEVAKLMFTAAEEDFAEFDMDVHEIRRLIDDIRLVRFDKIEKQFKQVTSAMTIRLTNFCAMELNLMRNFLLSSLDEYYKFSTAEESGDVQQQRQTQEMDEDESQDFQVRQLR